MKSINEAIKEFENNEEKLNESVPKELMRKEKRDGSFQLSSYGDNGGILAVTKDVEGMSGTRTTFDTIYKINIKSGKEEFTKDFDKLEKKEKIKVKKLSMLAKKWIMETK